MKCKYCDREGLIHVEPMMCPKHLDLAVICVFLDSSDEAVTVEAVQRKLAALLDFGHILNLRVEDVPEMMEGFSYEYRVEAEGVELH